jgi:integrase
MAIYKQKGSKNWWYKFNWNGALIRESTKQSNKRIAENMEAAHRASLARGEVGIREKKLAPTVQEFAKQDFLPFIESRFVQKPKTLEYYRNGVKNIVAFVPIASCRLDSVTADRISSFISKRRARGLQVTSINRQLEVLRRMFTLAIEWGKMNVAAPKVEMLSGENHRERVLTHDEELRYLAAATQIARDLEQRYERALQGLRAMRGEVPIKPEDPLLLRDVTTVLLDCALRPEECFRLRWEDVRGGALHVLFGKTANARRRIPLSVRVAAQLEERKAAAKNKWVFPAPTSTGHVEKSTIKKQHKRACKLAKVDEFTLYTFRHTCLTRWAEVMDPYTLAYLAGHSDFSTTKRYVHPQTETVLAAFERAHEAKTGHSFRHSDEKTAEAPTASTALSSNDFSGINGRGERIRTSGLLVPNQALYQAEPRPELFYSSGCARKVATSLQSKCIASRRLAA